ncbi:MAG: FG-GAP repeat protein [Planctomycetes bacterium]|nr:FG-GAP repeat protein [Planctomycetota bacterium]
MNPVLRISPFPTTLALTLAATVPLSAQGTLHTFHGVSAAAELGSCVRTAGDVDGDGCADLVVGIPGDATAGAEAGSARVYSGRDGTVLHTWYGDSPGDRFGASVGGAGDVDGDGCADLIVGSPGADGAAAGADAGSARVYSGRHGTILAALYGDVAGGQLGFAVAGAGDVDDDGYDDVIVGAPFDHTGGRYAGSARLHSGRTGARLYRFDGDHPGATFGHAVAGAGDVDGDGCGDVIVGAPDAGDRFQAGSAAVFAGRDGALLFTFASPQPGLMFGRSVSGAGDVDGDGFDDVVVGSTWTRDFGNPPCATVFSGRGGRVVHQFFGDDPEDCLGWSVGAAGDVDADGHDDVIAGAPFDDDGGDSTGSARVLSGLDGTVLGTFRGSLSGSRLGWSVGGAGDVNADGFADVIVGAPQDSAGGVVAGSARVLSGLVAANPAPPRIVGYGHGCPGSDGRLPRFGVRGRPVLGQVIALTLRAAPIASPAVIAFGLREQALDLAPFGAPGCGLWLLAELGTITLATDPTGRASIPLSVPVEPGLLGAVLRAQWVVVDLANAPSILTSDGVMLRIGQPRP